MKRQYIVAAVGAGALCALYSMTPNLTWSAPALAAPAKDAPKREGFNEPFVLAHLRQVKVVVGKLDAYATEHGASTAHITQLLKDTLAPTHIALSESDSDSGKSGAGADSKSCGPSDTPLMYLKVKVLGDEGGAKGATCSVSLSLVEKAKIARNKKDLMVSVWREDSVGHIADNLSAGIDSQVESVLKDFHRDYMLANSADSSKDLPEEDHNKSGKKHKFNK